MFLRNLAFATATVLAVAGSTASQLSVGGHDVAYASVAPHAETARFALTASTGVLAVSPDGTATVYENPGSAVAVAVDHAGVTTVSPVKRTPAAGADGEALSPVSTISADLSSAKSTLVVLDPQHSSTAPSLTPSEDAGQATGSTKYLPVILVHGTWSNTATEFEPTLLPALEAAGIQAFTYNYGRIPLLPINLIRGPDAGAEAPIENSTQRLAQEIAKVLAATGASQVNLIGASQGGLVIKNYLAHATDNAVANVVDINATNHGTTLNGPGKLLDPAIVDEAFAPVHATITGITQSLSDTLKLAGPLQILQGPVALAGVAAQVASGVAEEAVKIPVVAVQKVLRVALSLVIGPAGIQQAVGSEFLKRLNSTPDTKSAVNYLVLGSKNDTTATPYESTFLKASPGSAVINIEEHSLPGVKPTDIIGHVDTPQPVVDAIVRFLTTADTHPEIDAKIDRSLGVTITENSGTTTVRSGENTILYQGSSSDSAAIKQAIGQAIDADAPARSTALAAGNDTAQARAPQTDNMLNAAKTSSLPERTSAPTVVSTTPASPQPTFRKATTGTHAPTAPDDNPQATTDGARIAATHPGATSSADGITHLPPAVATTAGAGIKTPAPQQLKTSTDAIAGNVRTAPIPRSPTATTVNSPSTKAERTIPGQNDTKSSPAKTDAKARKIDTATKRPNNTTDAGATTPRFSTGSASSTKQTSISTSHDTSVRSPSGTRQSNTKSPHEPAGNDGGSKKPGS
ncbi:Putative triacylglycerol lipase precursor [Mycobacteroides abscessus subsp. bolletii]|nr:Putative triacylglycerol lipase precursor [Mycobacteroides abscessus subsp. bolletii]SKW96738.1 Putative triacylglycerol lipase precursor [Mycobacteroides abscessus subsp. bolletii]